MHCATGSQCCRSRSKPVTCEYFPALQSILAAAFITHCRRSYINDIPECISSGSKLWLYADDVLLHRKIREFCDSTVLQKELNELQVWERKWLMKFNPEKCFTLDLRTRPNPSTLPTSFLVVSWTLQPTTYRNQSTSSLAIMDQWLHISPTLLNTLVLQFFSEYPVGLPTVPEWPGSSRNWPTVSRVPGEAHFVPEMWKLTARHG